MVVGPASSVADALDLAMASCSLDGAILDVALDDEYSYPLADMLRERGVPFAFATGIDRDALPRAYASIPHISKPYEAASVVEVLFGPPEPHNSGNWRPTPWQDWAGSFGVTGAKPAFRHPASSAAVPPSIRQLTSAGKSAG